jgi:hypothetical protein
MNKEELDLERTSINEQLVTLDDQDKQNELLVTLMDENENENESEDEQQLVTLMDNDSESESLVDLDDLTNVENEDIKSIVMSNYDETSSFKKFKEYANKLNIKDKPIHIK